MSLPFLIADESHDHAAFLARVQELTRALRGFAPGLRAFQLEADHSATTYARFLALLAAGHSVLLSSRWNFQDESFQQLLAQEAQTDFIPWALSSQWPTAAAGAPHLHPLVCPGSFLVRTSGTSGKRFKLVVHSLASFQEKYRRRGPHFERTLAFSPIDSIAGIETLLETLAHRKSLVLPPGRPTPSMVAQLIGEHGIDYLQTTPSFLNLMVVAGLTRRPAPKGLKKIAYGSEPAQSKVLRQLQQAWEVQLMHTYGMSELGIQLTHTDPLEPTRFRLDERNPGRLVGGQLEVRSLTPMLGYLNHPAPLTADGWFQTGDVAQESAGYLQVQGRSGDLINVAGHKFFPQDLEEALMRMPEVLDATVVRSADELIGQSLTAQLVIESELPEIEFRRRLKDFLQRQVAPSMHPQRVQLVAAAEGQERFKKKRVL